MKLHSTKLFFMKVGELCAIFFSPQKDKFAQDISYIQKFYPYDKVPIQIFTSPGNSVSCKLLNIDTAVSSPVSLETLDISGEVLHYAYLPLYDVTPGYIYKICICEYPTGENDTYSPVFYSEPILICDNDAILETCLIEYSNLNNRSYFKNIFWINGENIIFQFRVEAGFKTSGVSLKVNNEQFRNQYQEIVELYSVPYKSETLIVGDACGVPGYYGEFINKILSVSKVLINGKEYQRSDSGVPDRQAISDISQQYNFTLSVEPVKDNGIFTLSSVDIQILDTKLRTIYGAEITLFNEEYSVSKITDIMGEANISFLPGKRYSLVIRKAGYVTKKINNWLPRETGFTIQEIEVLPLLKLLDGGNLKLLSGGKLNLTE